MLRRQFVLLVMCCLVITGCKKPLDEANTNASNSSSSGNSTALTENYFLKSDSTLAQRAAFLSDVGALNAFYGSFSIPRSGIIEVYHADGRGGCFGRCEFEKVVIDFAKGEARRWLAKSYTTGYYDSGIVLKFNKSTGAFDNSGSARNYLGVDNIKLLFVPVIAGDYSVVVKDSVIGWEHLASEITMPESMPVSGQASYSGKGIFDVRTSVSGKVTDLEVGAIADANASVNFASRTYTLDIDKFTGGPIGSVKATGVFYETERDSIYYPDGQTDGTKTVDVFDQNGKLLGRLPWSDATGDHDFINFVGPNASEIMGHPSFTIDTSVGGQRRITLDGAYVAKMN